MVLAGMPAACVLSAAASTRRGLGGVTDAQKEHAARSRLTECGSPVKPKGYLAVSTEPAPAPTNVDHGPQASVTTSGTVMACPAAARRTLNVVCVVPVGRFSVKLPDWP